MCSGRDSNSEGSKNKTLDDMGYTAMDFSFLIQSQQLLPGSFIHLPRNVTSCYSNTPRQSIGEANLEIGLPHPHLEYWLSGLDVTLRGQVCKVICLPKTSTMITITQYLIFGYMDPKP